MKVRYIVAGVVQKDDSIALGKKAKGQPPYPDVWHTPGGGTEDLEKSRLPFNKGDFDNHYFHEELAREMHEELGVEIKNVKCIVPKYRQNPREAETANKHGEMTHYYFLEYLCDYGSGELQADDDLAEARWVKKSELSSYSLTPPSQKMYKELGWL